ncbi:protein C1orf43 homolog [Tachypleus tridentatus]|uniref:protein C1orf43 homolog n=1 Tax=Tachypleus tridentatus TaxID=6853 RepID=UPI003FCF843F
MADQLSGIAVIIFIAFGVLTFVLLFIFAKRQIVRFSLKSRRGPHVPVGNDAPKHLRLEIERRLDCIKNIYTCYNPTLLKLDEETFPDPNCMESITPAHLYRMYTLESFADLETDLYHADPSKFYPLGQDVRVFLLRSAAVGLLNNCETEVLHKMADLYQHGRHEPIDFGPTQYKQFMELLSQIRQCVNHPSHKDLQYSRKKDSESPSKNKEIRYPVLNGKPDPILRQPTSLSSKSETEGKSVTFETSV